MIEESKITVKEQLEEKQSKLKERISELAKEQRLLDQEQIERKKQAKLEEKRASAEAKKELIDQLLKAFPKSRFVKQTKYFYKTVNELEEARKDESEPLDYLTEMNLIYEIFKRFDSCRDILVMDLRSDTLEFRVDLLNWQKQVDKRLKKLEKVKE